MRKLPDAIAGETIILDIGPVTRPDDAGAVQPINLTAAGTKIWFVAGRRCAGLDAGALGNYASYIA